MKCKPNYLSMSLAEFFEQVYRPIEFTNFSKGQRTGKGARQTALTPNRPPVRRLNADWRSSSN